MDYKQTDRNNVLLADCFQKARGTPQDLPAVFQWFLKAAEMGNTQGMTGWCIENGYGVDNLPLEWYAKPPRQDARKRWTI